MSRSGSAAGLAFMAKRLASLDQRGLRRRLTTVTAGHAPWVEMDGRRLLNLSSNNYLGLANHPEMVQAGIEGLHHYGAGTGSPWTASSRA